MSEPTKERFVTDLHVYDWPDAQVQLSGFKRGSDSFSALVTVVDTRENLVEIETVNLLAGRTRSGFAKSLASPVANTDEWASRLKYVAYTSLSEWAEGSSNLVSLPEIEVDYSKPSFLLPPFVRDKGVVIDYADGSAGKSMFELAKLLTIATGYPFLGIEPTRTGPVSYYDWEDSGETIKERAQALCDAAKIPVPAHFYYREMDRPVGAGEGRILREIEEKDVICSVFDSIGMMLGGDPSDPVLVIPAVNVMKRTGIACVGIHHLSAEAAKSTDLKDKQKGYGSVYVRNGARAQFYIDRFQEEEADEGYLFVFNTKVNRGKKSRPLAWHISYENDAQGYLRGLTYTQRSASDYRDFQKQHQPAESMTVMDAIRTFLTRRTSAGTATYPVETIRTGIIEMRGKEVSEQVVVNYLNEGKRDGEFVSFPSQENPRKKLWAVASNREEF